MGEMNEDEGDVRDETTDHAKILDENEHDVFVNTMTAIMQNLQDFRYYD